MPPELNIYLFHMYEPELLYLLLYYKMLNNTNLCKMKLQYKLMKLQYKLIRLQCQKMACSSEKKESKNFFKFFGIISVKFR